MPPARDGGKHSVTQSCSSIDDNWLAQNYVALVAKTLQQEPAIAALGA